MYIYRNIYFLCNPVRDFLSFENSLGCGRQSAVGSRQSGLCIKTKTFAHLFAHSRQIPLVRDAEVYWVPLTIDHWAHKLTN